MDPILDSFLDLAASCGSDSIIASPSRHVTLRDLSVSAQQISTWVDRQSLQSNSIVGISAPNGSAFLGLYLGLRMSSHPVLLLDHLASHVEVDRILRDLGCSSAILCDEKWFDSTRDLQLINIEKGDEVEGDSIPHNTSTVRLSSGTTGAARGIAHSSAGLLADDRALRKTMKLEQEIALATVPFSHAYGFSSLVLPAFTQGWKLVIPDRSGPLDPLKVARSEAVTFIPSVPAFLTALSRLTESNPFPKSLRLLICAGSHLDPETALHFRRRFGLSVHVFYGASEVGGISFDREGTAGERGTVGTPVDGVVIRIVDPGLELETDGVVEVKSPALALGYFPERSENAIGDWFKTADLGRLDESGELSLLGRVDEIVKVRGKPVNPREVEAVLKLNPVVKDAAVVSKSLSQGPESLLAALLVTNSAESSLGDILEWCRKRIAPHKIPRKLKFVQGIPRTPRGKIDKVALKSELEDWN